VNTTRKWYDNATYFALNYALGIGVMYKYSSILRRQWKTTFWGTGECSKSVPERIRQLKHRSGEFHFRRSYSPGSAKSCLFGAGMTVTGSLLLVRGVAGEQAWQVSKLEQVIAV